MKYVHDLIQASPMLALFVTIALGYLCGKIRIGKFVLGGIAGTLLVGVLIGQLHVPIDDKLKGIFFAMFIYAVGYQGGPQFFHSLNRRSLNELASAFVMALAGLLVVLAGAWIFGLDRGLAAGLAAGGLTQSSIIGTAGEAINNLSVSAEAKQTMQTNIAVGYAICYIFGSLGPIILVTWFFPTIMRWDVRAEAKKLEAKMSGGRPELEPGQFDAVQRVDTRFYEVGAESALAGSAIDDAGRRLVDARIEAIHRDGRTVDADADEARRILAGDVLAVTGLVTALEGSADVLGREVTAPRDLALIEEHREIILTNKALAGKSLGDLRDRIDPEERRGVFLTAIKRMGHDLPLLPNLVLHRGDEIQVTGRPKDLDRVQPKVGYPITAAAVTDFVFFGIGIAFGLFLGLGTIHVAGVPVTLGAGGGCLLSGLLFGWLRSVHPKFAALPTGASNFLRDFGLAVFVAIVGITAGPQALEAVRSHGLTLLLLGVGVTLIPPIAVFFFSYFVLRIRNPIEALACMVGGRSANPAFAALLNKAGNATPVVTFTVTYAVANVFLTLWGPLIVGIIHTNPPVPGK